MSWFSFVYTCWYFRTSVHGPLPSPPGPHLGPCVILSGRDRGHNIQMDVNRPEKEAFIFIIHFSTPPVTISKLSPRPGYFRKIAAVKPAVNENVTCAHQNWSNETVTIIRQFILGVSRCNPLRIAGMRSGPHCTSPDTVIMKISHSVNLCCLSPLWTFLLPNGVSHQVPHLWHDSNELQLIASGWKYEWGCNILHLVEEGFADSDDSWMLLTWCNTRLLPCLKSDHKNNDENVTGIFWRGCHESIRLSRSL